ncbi:MAG: hypothetical protein WA056_01620 [Gallionella sp.]
MSLYNNIAASLSAESLSKNGLTGSFSSGLDKAFGGYAETASSAMGGGKLAQAVTSMGQSMGVNAGMSLVNKYMPLQVQNAVNVGTRAVGDLMQGDYDSAGLRILDSGLLNDLLPGMSGVASQTRYWGASVPLFGGITPKEAKHIYETMRGQRLAKKNLWLIEVSSGLNGGKLNTSLFNLFATEVEYAPFTISGEKRRIGSASVDSVQSGEPIEMRLTTLDDQAGTLKMWFEKHAAAVVKENGTVGVPAEYAITIKVVHSFVGLQSGSSEYEGKYRSIGLFRPANMELSLSRREDGLQEVQMAFAQLDTFMRPTST